MKKSWISSFLDFIDIRGAYYKWIKDKPLWIKMLVPLSFLVMLLISIFDK